MIPLPDLILGKMANLFGTQKDKLAFLGGGREDSDGILYSFRQDNKSLVLKIIAIPYQEKEKAYRKIKARLRFVNYLGNNGVDIVYPVPNVNGNLHEVIQEGQTVFLGYIMEKVKGTHPTVQDYTPEFCIRYGKTIGKLHKITKGYEAGDKSGPNGENDLDWLSEWEVFYRWCKDSDVKNSWVSIRDQLSELPLNKGTYGFIHNDPHVQNILVREDTITLLDFDVAAYHWFATDISIAAQGMMFQKTGGMERPLTDSDSLHTFFRFFLKGYETENHLDEIFLGKMDLFINYRRALLFTVMQEWLDQNIAVRQSWKELILNPPAGISVV